VDLELTVFSFALTETLALYPDCPYREKKIFFLSFFFALGRLHDAGSVIKEKLLESKSRKKKDF
jgi:hypothetical protein